MTADLFVETKTIKRNEISIYLPPRLVLTPSDLKDGDTREVGILELGAMTSAQYVLETFVVAGATPIIRTYNHLDDSKEESARVSNALEAAYFLDNWKELQVDRPDLILAVHSYLGISDKPKEKGVGSQCLLFMDMEGLPTRENLDWITQNLATEGFTGAVIRSGNSFQYVSDFRVPEKNLHLFLSHLIGTLTPSFGSIDHKKISRIMNDLKSASSIQQLRQVGRSITDKESELYVPSVKKYGKPSGSFADLRYVGHRCSDESLGESIPFILRLSGGLNKQTPFVWAVIE